MKMPEMNCRSCFPHGDQPQCRTFEASIGAIRTFNTLFENNKMPMMCQGSDRHYRVCNQAVIATPLPATFSSGRPAEKVA